MFDGPKGGGLKFDKISEIIGHYVNDFGLLCFVCKQYLLEVWWLCWGKGGNGLV